MNKLNNTRNFYDTIGPFDATEGVAGKDTTLWWEENVDYYVPGLSAAIGCYLFTLAHGRRRKPWYVGMTVCKKGFCGEVFAPHKQEIYSDCMRFGTAPEFFLFPLVTSYSTDDGHRFSGMRSAKSEIRWLEKTLMGMAYSQNSEMANVKDMKHLKTLTVRGIMGPLAASRGRPWSDVAEARKVLLGKKRR